MALRRAILDLRSSILTHLQNARTGMKSHFRLVASLILLNAVLIGNVRAQSPSHSALVEGAKKEGKLVWYTSMALLDAFVKDCPFIKSELVRAGEEQLMNRILSETRAGRWMFDAVSTAA